MVQEKEKGDALSEVEVENANVTAIRNWPICSLRI